MATGMDEAAARERFQRSANQALMADLLGHVTGAETDLFSYEEVASRLKARQRIDIGTQMVPLELIVGSVGRYRDFTRTFLPRGGVDQERWTRVDAAMHSMEGLPPVELYKIGEVYFVRDGNHRVSVARANKLTDVEAYVMEVETDIPLTLDDFERDRWMIKAEREEFLQRTGLDQIRPEHGIILTEPGRFDIMLRHIEVHRYFRNMDLDREGSSERLNWEDAVASWYDHVYMPVIKAIRDYGLIGDFPDRTEADLYLWIALHREHLATEYGLAPLTPSEAVSTFGEVYSDMLLQRTVKGLRLGLYRVLGNDEVPLGMSEEEVQESRARHDAGEISIAEAEQRLAQDDDAGDGDIAHGQPAVPDGE